MRERKRECVCCGSEGAMCVAEIGVEKQGFLLLFYLCMWGASVCSWGGCVCPKSSKKKEVFISSAAIRIIQYHAGAKPE